MIDNKISWLITLILMIVVIILILDKINNKNSIDESIIFQNKDFIAYSFEVNNNNPITIAFYRNGSVRYLSQSANGFEQQLDFYDNGYLAARTLVDSQGNIQLGRYHFFESNGNLSHKYNYFNNKKVGVANSFHDNSFYLREYMEYDSSGCLRYRKTFDEFGKMVNEEVQ